MPAFSRIIGIDYSGAGTLTSKLKGVRVYLAEGDALPIEVQPPPSAKKHWTRRRLAEWLVDRLTENVPTLVGNDHGFSFPLRHFEFHGPRQTGRTSSMISGDIGQLMRITSPWISSVKALQVTVRRAQETHAGGA
jgi:hypothetical protein